MRSNLPNPDHFIGKDAREFPGYVIQEHIGDGCNAHVFRARSDSLGAECACKIIPRKNIRRSSPDPTDWMEEARKANTLKHSSVVKCQHAAEWKDPDPDPEKDIDCVVLYFEYVKGKNLRDYLKANKKTVELKFVEDLLRTLLELFHEMRERGLRHGDLHTGNILVEDPSDYQLRPKVSIRVTDFGIDYVTGSNEFGDDYEQLAVILKEMLENVNFQELSPRDKFAFDILNDHFLARHLVEKDPNRDPLARNPRGLFERLDEIDVEFAETERANRGARLTTPFDYLSCEQIGENHSLLRSLYSDLFLGLSTIESSNNLLLTGPRGCGKSMVYKSLSLKHRIHVNEDSPDRVGYVGVYYSCLDLYFSFPRYERPTNLTALDIPMHYLSATLLIGLLETIRTWSTRHFKSDFEMNEERVSKVLWEVLRIEAPIIPGRNTFGIILARLQKERKRSAERQRFANDPKQTFGVYFGPDILPKACEALRNLFPFLRGIPFIFFVDDYSSPKISIPLQTNLNRLLMQRSSSVFYKLSTESPVSYSNADIDGKSYVEGREFELLNLSLSFLQKEGTSKARFIADVFEKRFRSIPDYPVANLEELIGSDPGRTYNDTAREIRTGGKPPVWGTESIVDLCSGDIHYIINLVGKMVTSLGGSESLRTSTEVPKIPQKLQNKTIRDEAGNFLNNLRGIPKHGEQLSRIVTAFGNLAHYYLEKFDSGNKTGHPPHQASRIEPYDELQLSPEAFELLTELLRYSVFIEDPRGKSRRGKVVPRIYLRRFLIPHFNITFSKRDSISLENREIQDLLLQPEKFYAGHIKKKEKELSDMSKGQLRLPKPDTDEKE